MATLTIQEIPIGSQYTQAIGTDDRESLNDFPVRIIAGENVSDLVESSLSVSSGSIVSLEGQNSVWTAVVRPPETASVITFTVAADAVSEGNAETTKDIRISTSFPDADAEVPTELFSVTSGTHIAVSSTRIIVANSPSNSFPYQSGIRFYDFSGAIQTSEQLTLNRSGRFATGFGYINNSVILGGWRYGIPSGERINDAFPGNITDDFAHTRLGFITAKTSTPSSFRLSRYGLPTSADRETLTSDPTNLAGSASMALAHQDDLLYLASSFRYSLAEITPQSEINLITHLNIDLTGTIAIYQDTLYFLASDAVHTLDIRPYRPLAKNTKTTIYPVFANEGDTLPLKRYCPDAHTIVFSVGMDKPTYLSINADNELEIASNAVTETQPVLVKLTGINYIDFIDFQFYLIIVQAENPTVRDVDDLAMYASTTFDLFDIVDNATAITFRTGQTQPTGSSISSGVFTIGTAGGTAYFTATNANGSTNFEIVIDVVSVDADNFSDTFRYRTEIAGIDVSADVKGNANRFRKY